MPMMKIKVKLLCKSLTLLYFYLVVLGLSFAVESREPSQQIRFQTLSVTDGLPGQSVWAIGEDSSGLVWFGTTYGLASYDGYRLTPYKTDPDNANSISSDLISDIHLDTHNNLWVATSDGGINLYNHGNFTRYQHNPNLTKSISSNNVNALTSNADGLWIATDNGLDFLAYGSKNFIHYTFSNTLNNNLSNKVRSLLFQSTEKLLIGTNDSIYSFDLKTKQFTTIKVADDLNKPSAFRAIHKDNKGRTWLGTNSNLYLFYPERNIFAVYSSQFKGIPILSILSDDEGIWIGTFKNGLFLIKPDETIENYKVDSNDSISLAGENVLTLFKDRSGIIWSGSFSAGVSYFNPNSMSFGLVEKNSGLNCLASPVIHSFFKPNNEYLFIGTADGLYKYSDKKSTCIRVDFSQKNNSRYKYLKVNSINNYQSNKLFVSSNIGLSLYDLNNDKFDSEFEDSINRPTYFMKKVKKDLFLRGTNKGVFEYIPSQNLTRPVNASLSLSQSLFHSMAINSNRTKAFFATHAGLAILDLQATGDNRKLDFLNINDPVLNQQINALYVDDSIWIGSQSNKVYQYTHQGILLNTYPLEEKKENLDILSINPDSEGFLWITSTNGLFKIDTVSKKVKHYSEREGLQSDVYSRGAALSTLDGKFYLGGVAGFNYFDPTNIKDNLTAPTIRLTELRHFNQIVTPQLLKDKRPDRFFINKPIEYLTELNLGHKDYLVTIQFAGLHYADPTRNQYAYKIDGYHHDWIHTDSSNRLVTLSNLNSGNYLLRIKAANKDGIWNSQQTQFTLPITVYPAPWLTWWAYTIYLIVFFFSIYWFIHYRTKAAIQRSLQLEKEVTIRTKEINTQKAVIESLLERKNELFANISHEFRTPLTLILGPLSKELEVLDTPKNPKNLQMIERNATRLLGMVEQILKLTELKKEGAIHKVPHSIKPAIESIVESFQSLAGSKNISLELDSITDSTVMTSKDAIEVIFANLISNAIKYTAEGGRIRVFSALLENKIKISVSDTGFGMNKNQQQEIFDRFSRLDKTSDIAGTGIGLSIVKELVIAHEGTISVTSKEDVGSTFNVCLPLTEQTATSYQSALQAVSHLVSKDIGYSTLPSITIPPAEISDINRECLLIIDDNIDMQDYIKSTLENSYRCLTASRGLEGINTAINEIPDLIICDIMMPGIDGYESARRLRDNSITSHIPIILLTAKGDRESRIQGWNENIDDYMTKPFDQTELVSRIKNILSIRNILRRKAGEHIVDSDNKLTNKEKELPTLNKKEQAFVEKLMLIIKNNFEDPNFQKADIVNLIAMSERQLQRKTKALIDRTPMEILKEYRLRKAAEHLIDGESVSKTLELCGFNSMSHFSHTFKAFYQLSPKQYQLTKSN